MANWWDSAPIVEETPDFSDVRAAGSTNAGEREAARQFFSGGGYYSVPPVRTEHFDPSTPEGALNLSMAMGVGTAGLGAVAPAAGAFLATPAGGAVTGALPGLSKADPWTALKGAAYGAAAGGVGGKLIPFLLRLRSAAPAVTAAAPAAAPAASVPVGASSSGATFAGVPDLTRAAVPVSAAPVAAAAAPAAVAAPAVAAAAPAATRAASAAAPLAEEAEQAAVQIVNQASPETLKLMQLAKESGAEFGERVWFVIKDGVPKIVSPAQAGAAKRAGQVTTWVSNVLQGAPAAGRLAAPAVAAAPIAAAAPVATAAVPKVAATIQPGSEIWFYANRLRQVAETSKVNKAAVIEGIKKEFQYYGFPSAKAMTDFVFSQRTRP